MKQKQITTGKATIVVVDMPGNTYYELDPQFIYKEIIINQQNGLIVSKYKLDNDMSGYNCLGSLSQVTEDQWKEIVDSKIVLNEVLLPKRKVWCNYLENRYSIDFSPCKSGLSLLRANGVLLENPLGTWNGPDGRPQTFPDGAQFNSVIELYNFQKKWDKAQSEVWKNPYIFIKV
ncbi:hypothetical protein ACR79R_20175 [Sphingobacterium spiritivorum]|uniref:hypothetical protein n=1 Tax=Sphingobacterium spiritivorum TaxID=258 RepID=UPI003DA668B5